MTGACKLNNKMMRNLRRSPEYQCLTVDLAMLGVLSREECEMLIGSGIPKGLFLPNGTSALEVKKEGEAPKKETSEKVEVTDEDEADDAS